MLSDLDIDEALSDLSIVKRGLHNSNSSYDGHERPIYSPLTNLALKGFLVRSLTISTPTPSIFWIVKAGAQKPGAEHG